MTPVFKSTISESRCISDYATFSPSLSLYETYRYHDSSEFDTVCANFSFPGHGRSLDPLALSRTTPYCNRQARIPDSGYTEFLL